MPNSSVNSSSNPSVAPWEGPYRISRPHATQAEMSLLFPAFSEYGMARSEFLQKWLYKSTRSGNMKVYHQVLRHRQQLYEDEADIANAEHGDEHSTANTAALQSEDFEQADDTKDAPSADDKSNKDSGDTADDKSNKDSGDTADDKSNKDSGDTPRVNSSCWAGRLRQH